MQSRKEIHWHIHTPERVRKTNYRKTQTHVYIVPLCTTYVFGTRRTHVRVTLTDVNLRQIPSHARKNSRTTTMCTRHAQDNGNVKRTAHPSLVAPYSLDLSTRWGANVSGRKGARLRAAGKLETYPLHLYFRRPTAKGETSRKRIRSNFRSNFPTKSNPFAHFLERSSLFFNLS